MKKLFSLLSICFLFSALAQGQGARRNKDAAPGFAGAVEASDQVDAILRRYIEALGGVEALMKLRTRIVRGMVESSTNRMGWFESYDKAPNKSVTVLNLPGLGQLLEGFDGRMAWVQTPLTGAFNVNQQAKEIIRRNAEFERDLKLRDLFAKISLKGQAMVGNRRAFVLHATPKAGPPEVLYFDTENGLLLRMDMMREGPQANIPSSIFFETYAAIDGVKYPFVIRQIFNEFTLTYRITQVKHNVPIEDSLFGNPAKQ